MSAEAWQRMGAALGLCEDDVIRRLKHMLDAGVITRIGHSCEGQSVKDKVLLIPTTKGGVAGGWAFFDLLKKGIAPKALVFGKLNPVMVQGAVLAGMPITEGWEDEALALVKSGDRVRVDPAAKMLTVA